MSFWPIDPLAAIWLVVGVQLLPLPAGILAWIIPGTDWFLMRYDIPYAAGRLSAAVNDPAGIPFDQRHPLSIDPDRTRLAVVFFAGFALLLIGLLHGMTTRLAGQLARNVAVLGVVVAIAGLVQNAVTPGALYGFWKTPAFANPFGPFVNRNHFAGWMAMALPLAVGYVRALAAESDRPRAGDLRSRLIWLSSKDASLVIIASVATVVLMLSLLMTLSRSGIGCLAVVFLICAVFRAGRRRPGTRVSVQAVCLTLAALACVAWAGVDRLESRFASLENSGLSGRLGAWTDGVDVAGRFPLTGTGLNTYGTAMLLYQTHDLQHHYGAAHNDYVQLAAEGGLLLAIPAIALGGVLVRDIRRGLRQVSDREAGYWVRFGATTGLGAIAIQELFDFSLQIPANAMLFTVLLAIAAHQRVGATCRPRSAS